MSANFVEIDGRPGLFTVAEAEHIKANGHMPTYSNGACLRCNPMSHVGVARDMGLLQRVYARHFDDDIALCKAVLDADANALNDGRPDVGEATEEGARREQAARRGLWW